MPRLTWAALTAVALALPLSSRAADEAPPAGNWKLSFLNQGKMLTLWIVKFEKKDDQWSADVVATAEGGPPNSAITKVAVKDGQLSFDITIEKQGLSFEGKIPKEADKKLFGSLALGGQMVPAELEPTKLKKLDDTYEVAKEALAKGGMAGPDVWNAALELMRQAGEKKAKVEEVRGWASKALAAAEPYGTRWQREIDMRIASILVNQEGAAPVALEYAYKAKRLTGDEDFAGKLRVLNVLGSALAKVDKKEEAAVIEKEADQLFIKGPFQAGKYEGRKKKSDRAVLVELFTGAQCPPCVAADLAFDGLAKTYFPSEVVLVEYHLHVPRPDPLTNEDTVARAKYYDDEIEGTPAILFDGKLKPKVGGGGGFDGAKGKYTEYRSAIDPLLETEAGAKVTAKATRKGDKIEISAEASGAKGDKVRLRLLLVESVVRYIGGNQVRFHHHVVRAMPGGAEGVALKDGAAKKEVTVDLAHVRETINNYLNEFGKKNAFPDDKRPLDLKDLYLIAIVQNDETKDVLQAVQVKVEGESK